MLGTIGRKATYSSIGQTLDQGPFWAREMLDKGVSLWAFGSPAGQSEKIDVHFDEIVSKAYKACGPIFTSILVRGLVFSEVRFQFQEIVEGRPGRLFDDPSLSLLEEPWPNATTGELLWRMEQDASLAGNFFATTVGTGQRRRIRRLRPDWVTVVSGVEGDPSASPFELDADVLGYIYEPKGPGARGVAPVFLSVDRVVHYSPIPDPVAQWRGMSWIQSILPEVQGDIAATKHKLKFFENGATSNMVITYDASIDSAQVQRFKELFDQAHTGVDKAYKTLHLGGGADAKALGADLKQLDFKATQGNGETRIAAAAGVGAIIARFSEGLQGSSLNQGNYAAAKRQFGDMTMRPLWRTAAASLAKLTAQPKDRRSRLWYDTRDVEFLKDDRKDQIEILARQAETINSLVTAGYAPDAVIDAVEANDLSRLETKHTGMFSVQLQPAGATSVPKAVRRGQLVLDLVEE